MTFLAGLLGYFLVGARGMNSALLGGFAYILPNLVFVVRLKVAAASGVSFFVGEFGKVVATIGILVAVQQLYVDVHWIMMLVGLFAALKANLIAFLFKT